MHPKFIILLIAACFSASLAKTQTLTNATADTSKEIAFASDTQAPMWVETLWLKANHNRAATKLIFNSILARDPSSLFLLGDVVNLGYSNKQWKPIDKHLQDLRDKGIKVNAVLGNHEVMGQARKGQRKFEQRFPDHVRTGYVEIEDSIAVVLLNSNFNTLTPAEDSEQINWYKKTLQQLDADPAIQFVITGCHHSPFTNSKIVAPNTDVQKKFVPPFLASKKSRLFLSGHCHNFEHYQFGGKDFLVIGGGGGLHQPLRPNNTTEPDIAIDYKPLFHYLTIRRVGDHLQVCSHELKKDFSGFDSGLSFSINKMIETEHEVKLAKK